MRIAILTYPLSNNYGCLLQAYALQTILEQMGHDVVILNKRDWRIDSFWGWCVRLLKNTLLYYFNKKGIDPVIIQLNNRENLNIISSELNKFINTRLHLSSCFNFFSTCKLKVKLDFDAYVVGSDQVWRYAFLRKSITNYFFKFIPEDKIRIAYAASFGTDKWEYPEPVTLKCRMLMQKFKGVSVREDSGVELCKHYFQINAIHVVDPTFLIQQDMYKKIFNLSASSEYSVLLSYILDENSQKSEIINYISNHFSLNFKENIPKPLNRQTSNNISKCIYPSVDSWLQNMFVAKFVVTDSFHGCAFSIIFNRPFVVINNPKRGSARITSLLNSFGLLNRIVTSTENLSLIIDEEIDWLCVNNKIAIQQEQAIGFLKKYLNE